MGFWKFAANRVVDIFVPGAGLVLDIMDAIELIEVQVKLVKSSFDNLVSTCVFSILYLH